MEPRINLITLGVTDLQRSLRFYRDGLGFPTTWDGSKGVVFFKTTGSCFALYPYDKLAEDVSPEYIAAAGHKPPKFPGIALAHNVRTKEEVAQVLNLAKAAGATIQKPAQDTFWGGHSGYFSDPDGYLWEVAWGAFPMREDGKFDVP